MRWQDYIQTDPEIRGGKPCIVGTRATVTDVLEYLAAGTSEQQLRAELPYLKPEHICAVLAFAAKCERRLAAPAA
jgi:uncharacterized protein (DUF433 family)